jgi:hypothetical protein
MQMQFNPELGKPQASPQSNVQYPYHDAAGTVVYEGIRVTYGGIFCCTKTVYRRPGEADYKFDPTTSDVRFYQLPELNKALNAGQPIVITGDEPTADLLRSEGYAATTCAGGMDHWPKEHEIIFKGAVIHVGDPGRFLPGNLAVVAERLAYVAKIVIVYTAAGPVTLAPAAAGGNPSPATTGTSAPETFGIVLSSPEDVENAYGKFTVRSGRPTKPFWKAWRAIKDAMRAVGWTCDKDETTDQWTVKLWQETGVETKPDVLPPDLGEALAYLDYHFGDETRHLVAIKKSATEGK